ncbi:atpA1 [Acrasis kona]|uniref:AtpA1 n=1 Tax=Acrasis kona TaxID=1008807 RepID=A0AAW2ZQM7_9EUKA
MNKQPHCYFCHAKATEKGKTYDQCVGRNRFKITEDSLPFYEWLFRKSALITSKLKSDFKKSELYACFNHSDTPLTAKKDKYNEYKKELDILHCDFEQRLKVLNDKYEQYPKKAKEQPTTEIVTNLNEIENISFNVIKFDNLPTTKVEAPLDFAGANKYHPTNDKIKITDSHVIQTSYMNANLLAYNRRYIPQNVADRVYKILDSLKNYKSFQSKKTMMRNDKVTEMSTDLRKILNEKEFDNSRSEIIWAFKVIERAVLVDLETNNIGGFKRVASAMTKLKTVYPEYPFEIPVMYININGSTSSSHYDKNDCSTFPGYVLAFKTPDCHGGDLYCHQINVQCNIDHGGLVNSALHLLYHSNTDIVQGSRCSAIVPFHNRFLKYADMDQQDVMPSYVGYFIVKGKLSNDESEGATQLKKKSFNMIKYSLSHVKKREGKIKFAFLDDSQYQEACQSIDLGIQYMVTYGYTLLRTKALQNIPKDLDLDGTINYLCNARFLYDESKINMERIEPFAPPERIVTAITKQHQKS